MLAPVLGGSRVNGHPADRISLQSGAFGLCGPGGL